MVVHSTIGLEEQLQLRIDKEFRSQLDDVITEMQKVAKKFDISQTKEKSPFKNILAASTEPMSSLEATKNLIRYQVGRKESSKVWKLVLTENGKKQFFAEAVVQQLDGLSENCKTIFATIQTELEKEIESLNEDNSRNENNSRKEELELLLERLKKNKASLQKTVHLNLAQLYLGYLSREHTALLGFRSDKDSKYEK
jgi:hypothetical protein